VRVPSQVICIPNSKGRKGTLLLQSAWQLGAEGMIKIACSSCWPYYFWHFPDDSKWLTMTMQEHFRNPGQNGIERLISDTFWLLHQLHYSIRHHPTRPSSVVCVHMTTNWIRSTLCFFIIRVLKNTSSKRLRVHSGWGSVTVLCQCSTLAACICLCS
jgi:hypothetical protein